LGGNKKARYHGVAGFNQSEKVINESDAEPAGNSLINS